MDHVWHLASSSFISSPCGVVLGVVRGGNPALGPGHGGKVKGETYDWFTATRDEPISSKGFRLTLFNGKSQRFPYCLCHEEMLANQS